VKRRFAFAGHQPGCFRIIIKDELNHWRRRCFLTSQVLQQGLSVLIEMPWGLRGFPGESLAFFNWLIMNNRMYNATLKSKKQ
jgi:hypothetical protein